MNIAHWLYRTSLKSPDASALYQGAACYATYHQFAQRAFAIGERLKRDYDVQPGDRVAIFLKNRVEYLEILYGAWWLGAVVVPINAKLHAREAAWIVDNAEAKLLFTDYGTLGQDISLIASCREIAVEGNEFAAMKASSNAPTSPVSLKPNSLAWLFYTSGTTGRPKGVMLSHDNLIAMSTSYTVDVDSVSHKDACLYAAPMSHGAGMYNFIHVRVGAKHIVPPSRGFDPVEIFDLAETIGNISLFAAPTMVKRLVDSAKHQRRSGKGIKSIIYGGGPMYTADIEEALTIFGPKLIQIYGQGESPMTITALQRDLIADTTDPQWRNRLGSVGSAHSCVEVQVVDKDMNELPTDTPGEIVVRGATVMLGYWRNTEATQNTIVNGWLKTGDIGKLDAHGFLTLTDRSKDVVISGGTNIYPREVEEVLVRCPGVGEVAVIGAPSAEWGEVVVAFVVLTGEPDCSEDDLNDWCGEQMAAFKRPKRYLFVKALPKNAYGKVLKTELRKQV